MNVKVCITGLCGRGVDDGDGDEDNRLRTEERLDWNPVSAMSSWYGRWPIGDRPRERIPNDWELILRFSLAGGAGDGACTDARGASGAGGETGGETGATYWAWAAGYAAMYGNSSSSTGAGVYCGCGSPGVVEYVFSYGLIWA